MTKIVCDLCGKDVSGSVLLKPISDFRMSLILCGSALDLCEDCKTALDKWCTERKAKNDAERESQE